MRNPCSRHRSIGLMRRVPFWKSERPIQQPAHASARDGHANAATIARPKKEEGWIR